MIPAWITALLSAILNALASAWRGRQQDQDAAAAHERAGAAEAANETQQTIAETADERSQLPSEPDDAAALAQRLRDKASARAGGGGTNQGV